MIVPGQQMNTKLYLENIRQQLGEERLREEIIKLATQAAQLGNEKHDVYWKNIIQEFGLSASINYDDLRTKVKANPDPTFDSNRVFLDGLKQQMPGIKTQAHFTSFMVSFDVFRQLMNAIFTADLAKEAEFRKALDTSFIAAHQVAEIAQKLCDVPEAATNKGAEEFKKPPAEFQEYDVQMALLAELEQLKDSMSFTTWYGRTKEKRDSVKSQSLRNALMDAIRAKKVALEQASA